MIFILLCQGSYALALSGDSTSVSNKKAPKNYIRPCIFTNSYSTPEKKVDDVRLKSYKYSQFNFGFYAPLFTNTKFKDDSTRIATFHLLATGSFVSAKPYLGGFNIQYAYYKTSLGLRAITADGGKNTWFFDAAPFVAEDFNSETGTSKTSPTWRFYGSIIYNRTASKNFSYRLGVVKTYVFGRGIILPFAGVRFGPLDGVHYSIWFPKSMSVDFPMGKKFWGSVFMKPMGGIYNFYNPDTTFRKNDHIIQFGRYEYLLGFNAEYRPNSHFSVNVGLGFSGKRIIGFADNNNTDGTKKSKLLYYQTIPTSGFLQVGLSVRIGAAKKIRNNYQMYDVLDLNNSMDPGDNNSVPGNGDIPNNPDKVKIKNIQYNDVKDLIEMQDM